ncbi:hypothetical protein F5X97DRAFT_82882 [Nemania serpens]|nr:hypothetical protein F5X97DRAFT_82882 [Nemania serpens]
MPNLSNTCIVRVPALYTSYHLYSTVPACIILTQTTGISLPCAHIYTLRPMSLRSLARLESLSRTSLLTSRVRLRHHTRPQPTHVFQWTQNHHFSLLRLS